MSTYTQITYQVVFSAKHRAPVFRNRENRKRMYTYIRSILQNKRCFVHAVNGVEDHLHLVFDLHPSIALASLIKDIKLSTSGWIRDHLLFPGFSNWKRGYSAFTYSKEARPDLIQYVKNQEEHHLKESSSNELRRILREKDIAFEERYFE